MNNPQAQKENKKSTPVENEKATVRNHANQSTEANRGGNMGLVAVIVLIAIIALGLWFFGGL